MKEINLPLSFKMFSLSIVVKINSDIVIADENNHITIKISFLFSDLESAVPKYSIIIIIDNINKIIVCAVVIF